MHSHSAGGFAYITHHRAAHLTSCLQNRVASCCIRRIMMRSIALRTSQVRVELEAIPSVASAGANLGRLALADSFVLAGSRHSGILVIAHIL